MFQPRMLARAALACALSCSLALGSVPALAQSAEDRAAARSLAAEGSKLFTAGDYEQAIDRFTRAEALVHAPPHLLYLARANEKLGKLVVAREHYLKITKETLAPGAPKAFADAKKDAEKELAALEPRIGALQVNVKGAPAGAKVDVTIDGQPLNAALIGVSRPIDPGTHKIEARADKLAGEASVTVAEGSKESVDVELKPVAGDAPPPPPVEEPPPPPPPAETSGSSTKYIGYGAIGVGVLGVAAGTFFLLRSSSKRSDADALCPGGVCPEERRSEINSLDDEANSARTLSYVGFGVGVVGVGVGVALLVIGSGGDKKAASAATLRTGSVTMQPWATWNGVGLSGSF